MRLWRLRRLRTLVVYGSSKPRWVTVRLLHLLTLRRMLSFPRGGRTFGVTLDVPISSWSARVDMNEQCLILKLPRTTSRPNAPDWRTIRNEDMTNIKVRG